MLSLLALKCKPFVLMNIAMSLWPCTSHPRHLRYSVGKSYFISNQWMFKCLINPQIFQCSYCHIAIWCSLDQCYWFWLCTFTENHWVSIVFLSLGICIYIWNYFCTAFQMYLKYIFLAGSPKFNMSEFSFLHCSSKCVFTWCVFQKNIMLYSK